MAGIFCLAYIKRERITYEKDEVYEKMINSKLQLGAKTIFF
jgi:hypothetical protein